MIFYVIFRSAVTPTVKPVLIVHSKIDKIKFLMTNCSLMKVKSMQNAPLGAFCDTFDLHYAIIGLENIFGLFESGSLDRFHCSLFPCGTVYS